MGLLFEDALFGLISRDAKRRTTPRPPSLMHTHLNINYLNTYEINQESLGVPCVIEGVEWFALVWGGGGPSNWLGKWLAIQPCRKQVASFGNTSEQLC